MSCQKDHQGHKIKLICISPQCRQYSFICDLCIQNHNGHPTISITKFSNSLVNHVSKPNPRMRIDLECAAQQIYKLRQRIANLSQLMNDLHDMFNEVEEVGEEQDQVNVVLRQHIQYIVLELLSTSKDYETLNAQFSDMFLLLQPTRTPATRTRKAKLRLHTSNICQIRSQLVLDRQTEFSLELVHCMTNYASAFRSFAKRAKSLFATQCPDSTKTEEREGILQLISSSHEDILGRPLTGIERCDVPEAFHGSRKHMIKICNYWIFYNSIVCEGTFAEPTLREHNLQAGKRVLLPIRCAICRLVKQKDFVQNYFRFDPAKRCGALCWFRDDKREICVHELCLLWSNRIQVNYETFDVDFYTIITAVQYALQQKCRFCGHLGAPMKCNQPECQTHFHFHCIRAIRLMSMQLDFEGKYRFFCEDHVVRTIRYNSNWFMTRKRLMQMIQLQNNLLPPVMRKCDFIREKQCKDIDSNDDSSIQTSNSDSSMEQQNKPNDLKKFSK